MSSQVLQRTFSITLAGGASVATAHGIRVQNAPVVPNWIIPDRPTALGVTAHDDTTFTLYNPTGGALTALFTVKLDHTIQRDPDDPSELIWVGGAASSSGNDSSYIELSGMTLVAGSYTPVSQVRYVYLQSDYGASGAWLGPGAPTYGDDSNPGTKDKPFRTIQGIIQRFGRRGIQGVLIVVKMGGYSVMPAGGWPASPIAANDPWDGDPEQDRSVFSRDLEFTGTDNFMAGYAFHSPRKMFPSTVPLTFMGAVQVGLRVQLTFAENAFAGGSRGSFLRLYQPDGRDVFFPHVISEVTAPNVIMVEPPFTAADWNFWAAAPNVCRGSVPAVQLSGGPDYEATGVHVHGFGAGKIGNGRTGGGEVTTNPIPQLYSTMVIRGTYDVVGQWMACACWFDDGVEFGPGGQPFLKGCTAGPNGYVRWASAGRVLNADSSYLLNREICGYALVPELPGPPPPDVNPVVGTIGPNDLVITGDGAFLIVTDALGAHPGDYRAMHGLSVITTGGIHENLRVNGNGKFVQLRDAAAPCPVVLHTDAALPCVWGTGDGTTVYLNPAANRLELVNGGGGTLRTGKGAAIAEGVGVGEWLEVLGYNGYFTRRHEVSGTGFPTDDTSAIVATTWMPAGYEGDS